MSEVEPGRVSSVKAGSEREQTRGWSYAVSVWWSNGRVSEHEVTLSHHDYEHWCGGVEPPSRVAERAVRIGAEVLGAGLAGRFDLSQLRRRVEGFDVTMREG
ncbi:MAG: hypothetical protein DYG94_11920 [Leptolyngbya sp. PLA3]|nr:MAG: hypothetical protein EDM82_05530 [Cyanobacteria bacterium CYA]MCE7969432.1 hypothetical protein [Leptolyngbya sp. PL-A3]